MLNWTSRTLSDWPERGEKGRSDGTELRRCRWERRGGPQAGTDAAGFKPAPGSPPEPTLSGKSPSAPSLPAPSATSHASPSSWARGEGKDPGWGSGAAGGRARTGEGADGVLLAQVEALHVAVLRAAEEHVHLGGVEADLVDRALVLGEELVLLVARRLAQVPGDHHAVGGGRGQQVLVHLVPHHVGAAEVERGLAAHAEVQLLHELLLLDAVDLEDVAPGHHHLGGVAAHADGVGGGVQVAEHGAPRQRRAAQRRAGPRHLLHGRAGRGDPSPGRGLRAWRHGGRHSGPGGRPAPPRPGRNEPRGAAAPSPGPPRFPPGSPPGPPRGPPGPLSPRRPQPGP
uniref:Uncharacterized protein n=1 Tax=Anser brachyrhynchus TaxID=132585 RepID=A0A8B9B9A2_9AVES